MEFFLHAGNASFPTSMAVLCSMLPSHEVHDFRGDDSQGRPVCKGVANQHLWSPRDNVHHHVHHRWFGKHCHVGCLKPHWSSLGYLLLHCRLQLLRWAEKRSEEHLPSCWEPTRACTRRLQPTWDISHQGPQHAGRRPCHCSARSYYYQQQPVENLLMVQLGFCQEKQATFIREGDIAISYSQYSEGGHQEYSWPLHQ